MAFRSVLRAAVLLMMISACGALPPPTPAPTLEADAPQASVPPGSCALDLPTAASAEEKIRAVLEAEGRYVVGQEIAPLMALWVEGAQVTDAKNTPDDTADDQLWQDKITIQHRYVHVVFPGAPAVAQPADLTIHLAGDTATVEATTQIGSEVSPAGDRWMLEKIDDCWLLAQLTYNLEPDQ